MPRQVWPWLAVLMAGCASGPAASAIAPETIADDRVAELGRIQNDQARRISELEARLQLLEADARSARGPTDRPSATVRIGGPAAQSGGGNVPEEASATLPPGFADETPSAAGAREPRPNLKLKGRSRASSADLPPLPVTNETLSVVPLPQERSRARQAEAEVTSVSDPATSDYRAALRLLRDRRFEEAGLALSKFVSDNPDHALLDRAMYWLAEVRYATRDYRAALSGFENVLQQFPNSEKAPDTLYKLGMCWRQLGVEERARSYFRRLREQYPNSEAAGLASREGST
ncbi:MAG TPA: tol-pal system protein YbgF [Polyangiales bacterium]|nr:tol-pal system protein YbgF [Polyangiales bacterium]